jgi:GTP cyclohydrolase II
VEIMTIRNSSPGELEQGSWGRVRIWDTAKLPTEFGEFTIVNFSVDGREVDDVAIVAGDVKNCSSVLTRIHSECLTGDALGSLRCDCRAQLQSSLRAIAEQGCGVVLYLRQEGRGIGLFKKVAAYALQDGGLDTVDANLALGMPDDCRSFGVAAEMLHALGIASVRLLTNNPNKVSQIVSRGVIVVAREAHSMKPTPQNEFYLRTKAARSGHILSFEKKKQP